MNRLMTPRLEEAFKGFPLYSQDGKGKDAVCVAIFAIGNARWFVLEGSKEGDDTIMFCIVVGLAEDASRCLGTPVWRVLTKNIFPYLISIIILRLALSIPATIALESTLSYLGLGLGIENPSLGILLRNARNYFLDRPYLLIFPAVIVSLITITFYLVGNAFSDAADPRNHV